MKKSKESSGLLLMLLVVLAIVFMVLFVWLHADAMPILYTENRLAQEIGGQYAL